MPEITIDTDDPKLLGRLSVVLSHFLPPEQRQAAERAVLDALRVAPEPAEPPPGVYRDQAGSVWYRTVDDEGMWRQDACNSWLLWHIARELVSFPLVRLWTAAELIPDPDDREAVGELVEEALAEGYIAVTELGSDLSVVIAVCRVLRSRAVKP
jgi:hypothetical protein